jgi:hypothetical protein
MVGQRLPIVSPRVADSDGYRRVLAVVIIVVSDITGLLRGIGLVNVKRDFTRLSATLVLAADNLPVLLDGIVLRRFHIHIHLAQPTTS